MASLRVAILGLGRLGASVGLALKRYSQTEGKYQFECVGHDFSPELERRAREQGIVARTERLPEDAVRGADIVVQAMGYEDVRTTYKDMAIGLRDGVVILETAPLKQASLEWATKYLKPEHHVVGLTPIVNPAYLYDARIDFDAASADYFDKGAILISPAASAAKEAVELAYNFGIILGGKPRFLDPQEHDALMAHTSTLPELLGVLSFYAMRQHPSWEDAQWLTPPIFGALTRPLKDVHPDAFRDEWIGNRDAIARALGTLIEALEQTRQRLLEGDQAAIEALASQTSEQYAEWVNRRHRADWEKGESPKPEANQGGGIMSMLFGAKLAERWSKRGKQS